MAASAIGRLLPQCGAGSYRVRLVSGGDLLRAAQRLRFEVFNVELNEGLSESYSTGLDADPYDEVCDHLVVRDETTGAVVGTYRLQTGAAAARNRGYYSEQEFDFSPFEKARSEIIELGRACVHAEHRNLAVLTLLWRGIAAYAREHRARYLIGCSSLTSQDPGEGAAMYAHLRERHLAPVEWRTRPKPEYACPVDGPLPPGRPRVPKLLGAYLTVGARICGPPAIDREFKTIDFLTFLDLRELSPNIAARFLSGRET